MRNGLVGLWSLFSLGISAAALAQAPAELPSAPTGESAAYPRHVLSLNPFGHLLGFHAAEYEVALQQRVSLFVQPGISRGGGNGHDLIEIPSGPYLSGGVRFFFTGEAPTGLFVSPGFHALLRTFWNAREQRPQVMAGDSRFGLDLVLGGAWQVGPHFYLSGGLGAMYSVRPGDGASSPTWHSLLPTARANLGYAF